MMLPLPIPWFIPHNVYASEMGAGVKIRARTDISNTLLRADGEKLGFQRGCMIDS